MMTPELTLYAAQLQTLIDRVCQAVEELGGAQLNWRPPVAEANSVYVIATHTLGNAEAWVLGIACGQPIERDRPAEFRSSGADAAPIVARARDLQRRFDDALRALPDSALDELRDAPPYLWGAGEARQVSAREALIHVIEHASNHLGHIDLTRDLALANAKG